MADIPLKIPLLANLSGFTGPDGILEILVPPKRLKKKYLKQLPDFWNEDLKWKDRKRIAIDFLEEEKSEFLHAYKGETALFYKEVDGQTLTLNFSRLGLTPLIYSIWGEMDRGNNEKDFSSQLINDFIATITAREKRGDKSVHVYEHLEKELGHAILHGILPNYTDFDIIKGDRPFSLQYLIESNKFTLVYNHSKISQIGCSAEHSIRCNNIIIKYLIDELKKINFSDDKPFEIFWFLESDLKFILSSSSKHLPALLDILLISSRQQIQGDSQELPLIKLIDSNGFLNKVKLDAIKLLKNNTKGREVLNCEIYNSAIKFPSVHGSKESLQILESLASYENSKIFRCRIIQYYLKYKWDTLWYYILFQTMVLWSNLPLLFIMIFIENHSIEFAIAFIIVNSFLIITEILQVTSMGLFQYFGDLRPELGRAILAIVCLVVFPVFDLNVIALCSFGVLELYIFSSTKAETFIQCICSMFAFVFFSIPMILGLSARFLLVPTLTIATVYALFIALTFFSSRFPRNIFSKCINLTILPVSRNLIHGEIKINCTLSLSIIALCACNTFYAWEEFNVVFPVYCISNLLLISMILNWYFLEAPYHVRMYLSSIRLGLAFAFVVLDYNIFLSATLVSVIVAEFSLIVQRALVDVSWIKLGLFILDLSSMACIFLNYYYDLRESEEFYFLITSGSICFVCAASLILDSVAYSKEQDDYQEERLELMKFLGITVVLIANLSNAFMFKIILIVIAAYKVYFASINKEKFIIKFYEDSIKFVFSWNFIDMSRIFLSVMWLSLYFNDETDSTINCALLSMTFLRGMTGFRCFDASRFYVRLIFRSLDDIKSFIMIFFYSTLAFGIITFSLSGGTVISLSELWIASYDMNLGQSNHSNELNLQYLIFLLASICNVIIMLNLLISILGDSYDRFQVSALEIDYIEMTEALREIEITMNLFNHDKSKCGYLTACDFSIEQGLLNMNEWEGKILLTEKHIKAECLGLKKDIARIDDFLRKMHFESESKEKDITKVENLLKQVISESESKDNEITKVGDLLKKVLSESESKKDS